MSTDQRDRAIELLGGQSYKPAIWQWQFEDVPEPDRVRLILASDATGAILGFNGSIPVRVQLDGSVAEASWSCDFIVEGAARGQGVGTQMKGVLRRECAVLMASGISPAADRVHLATGWARGAILPRFSRVQRIHRWQDVPRVVLQMAARWLEQGAAASDEPSVSCEIVDARLLPEEAAQLWEHVAAEYPNAVIRNASYLAWRYGRHPLMRYRAIVARRNGRVCAVGFFWATEHKAALVDYVGSRRDAGAAKAIVRRFAEISASSARAECSTTEHILQHALSSFGFINPRRNGTLFNVYPGQLAGAGHDWFLMGGDSDGDILAAAKAGSDFSVERWDEARFMAARAEWTELLLRSNADRLFLSWEWLSCWWSTYARNNGLELVCMAARDGFGRLVGLAPLYIHRASLRGLGSKRLQFMGNIWRGEATMRTEYLEFVVDRTCADSVVRALLDSLSADSSWSDLVLTDLDLQSATYRNLREHPLSAGCYLRFVAQHTGYGIDTQGEWDEYLRRLTGNQRRKLYLQRRRLEERGEVRLETFNAQRFQEFAERLDHLHTLRWGRRFFVGDMRRFHESWLGTLDDSSVCHASILTVDGRDVSALYNVRIAGREYNLQGGFEEQFSRGISVALLHLGYVIEAAFEDRMMSVELLVGGGKRSDFKANVSEVVRRAVTVHALRAPVRQVAYRVFDGLKRRRWRR